MKRGVPLRDKIGLAGDPQAVPFGVGKHDNGPIIRRWNGSDGGGFRSLERKIGLLRRDSAKRKKTETGKEQLPRASS
jgi:hypothetical protein